MIMDFDKAGSSGEKMVVDCASEYSALEMMRAVERKNFEIELNSAIDMWSFGSIAYKVLTGTFQERHSAMRMDAGNEFITAENLQSGFRLDSAFIKRKLSRVKRRPTRKFLSKFLRSDPRKRPTPQQILKCSYFAKDGYSRNCAKHWVRNKTPFDAHLL